MRESKGLLIGERAAKELSTSIIALAENQSGIEGANGVVATHLAPDQVVVALSLEFADELRTSDIEKEVQELEARIREKQSEVIALFVKPQNRKGLKDAVRTSERDVAFASASGTDRAARESGEDSSNR